MKKSMLIKTMSACAVSIAAGALLLSLSCTEENGLSNAFLEQRKESADYVTDSRDGQKYRAVKVGGLTWMAENLNYRTVNSYCYADIDANCEKYGRLYEWQDAVFSACPAGWHLPTEVEWLDLETAVGDNMRTLKARNWGGTDKYGWTALPSGYRIGARKAYGGIEEEAWWWTATYRNDTTARAKEIEWDSTDGYYNMMRGGNLPPKNSQAVRCVKDDGGANRVTVSFNTNGGTPNKIDAATIDGGKSLYNYRYDSTYLWPERDGYRLVGWSDGSKLWYDDDAALTPITRNITLTAQWVREFNVYFENNGEKFIYFPVDSASSIFEDYGLINDWYTVLENPGYIMIGWFSGNTEYTQYSKITADVTLSPRWRKLRQYPITFNTNGGTPSAIPSVEADSGTAFGKYMPATPTRSGFFFDGWFVGNIQYTDTSIVHDTLNLTAKWHNVPGYTVSFNTNGGTPSTISPVPVDSGSTLAGKLPANPTKTGNYFGGWFDGNTRYDANTIITKNVTLVAKWSETTKYTVSFNTNGGTPSTISPVQADSGSAFGTYMPATPARSGYFFDGWLDGTTKYTAQTIIVKSVTLTATWRKVPTYIVSFNANGGTLSTINSIQVDSGSAIGSNMPTPTRTGYHFGGWFDGTTQYTAATPITKTVTLTAQWNIVSKFTVSFNTDGGTPTVSSVQADSGLALGANFPTAKPAKAGYLFLGWYDGTAKYTQQTVITKNVTLIAKYELMALEYEEFTDERDDMIYHKVRIGEQTWMAENLNYKTTDSRCYDGRADNCAKYGRLYNWIDAMNIDSYYSNKLWGNDEQQRGVCPAGWHLPSRQEWQTLVDAVGGDSVAGGKLKAIKGWDSFGSRDGNGTDVYKFSALPGGRGLDYYAINTIGWWWTATESSSDGAYERGLYYTDSNISEYSSSKRIFFYSVRCVQD